MVKRKRAEVKRAVSPAEILYFLEDGRVTSTPWDQPQSESGEDNSEQQPASFDDSTPVPPERRSGKGSSSEFSLDDDEAEELRRQAAASFDDSTPVPPAPQKRKLGKASPSEFSLTDEEKEELRRQAAASFDDSTPVPPAPQKRQSGKPNTSEFSLTDEEKEELRRQAAASFDDSTPVPAAPPKRQPGKPNPSEFSLTDEEKEKLRRQAAASFDDSTPVPAAPPKRQPGKAKPSEFSLDDDEAEDLRRQAAASFDDSTPVPAQQPQASLEEDDEQPSSNRRDRTLICEEEDLPWLESDPVFRKKRNTDAGETDFQLDMLELPEEADIESDDIEELEAGSDAANTERTLVEDVEEDDDEPQPSDKSGRSHRRHSFSDKTPTLKPKPAAELADEFDLESEPGDLEKSPGDTPTLPPRADRQASAPAPSSREESETTADSPKQPAAQQSGALRGPAAHARSFSRGRSLSLRMSASGSQSKTEAQPSEQAEKHASHDASREVSHAPARHASSNESTAESKAEPKKISMAPAPATGEKDVDDASICLLSSPQALNHFKAKLKPMTTASLGALAQRAQWATAALFGQQLFASGRPVPAQKVLEHLVEDEKPTESFPYAMLGALHLSLGNDAEAERRFDEALEIDQTDLCALLGRAEICLRSARPTDALVDVKLAISQAKLDESPLLPKAEAMLAVTQKMIRFLS